MAKPFSASAQRTAALSDQRRVGERAAVMGEGQTESVGGGLIQLRGGSSTWQFVLLLLPGIDTIQVAGDGLRTPMKSTAKTVEEYVKSLPEDRREAMSAVRKVILDNLPKGYQECMSYGMIGYVVPHSIYPKGHHCDPKLPLPFVNLGSKKNDMALHLMWIDAKTDQWFRKAWQKTGRKLNGGKRLERGEDLFAVGCIRFKRLEDVPLEVVGQLIARTPVANYIARIESVFDARTAKGSKSKPGKAKR